MFFLGEMNNLAERKRAGLPGVRGDRTGRWGVGYDGIYPPQSCRSVAIDTQSTYVH